MAPEPLVLEEVTDPVEIARIRAALEQAKLNADWLETHWDDLLPAAFGKFIAVAGQKAFIADSPEAARRWADEFHPEDRGALVEYVLPPGGPRYYANRR